MLSFSHSFFSLSCTLQGAGGVGGLLAVIRDGEAYAPTYDANGNVSEYVQLSAVQTDNYPSLPIAGGIVAHYEYSPFGEITAQSGGMADGFTFRFSTKYYESETGIIHYEIRPYRPSLGCWMSRDPIEERGGMNLYGFVRNCPTMAIDRDGRDLYSGGGGNVVVRARIPILPGSPLDWGGYPELGLPSKGNCWMYACNDPAKPGEHNRDPSKPSTDDGEKVRFTCNGIMKGARQKGAKNPDAEGKCPCNHYLIKAVVAAKKPNGKIPTPDGRGERDLYDYHWYRQNDDGSWSNKHGDGPVEKVDDPITDANKYGYDTDCGNLCVPENGINTR